MGRVALRILFVLGLSASGCSFLREQFHVTTVSECVHRECSAEEGAAHQKCMGECRTRYGN